MALTLNDFLGQNPFDPRKVGGEFIGAPPFQPLPGQTGLMPITIDPVSGQRMIRDPRTGGLMPVDQVRPPIQNGLMPVGMSRPPIQGGTMPVAPQPTFPTQPVAPMPMPGAAPILHPNRGTGYGPGGRNLYDTPFVRDYLSPLLPEGEFGLRLNRIGMGDTDTRRGQFGQSQYGNTQRLYQQAQLRRPGLSFRDFLSGGGAGGLQDRWKGMTAGQRGLNAPSRSSVIRWG
jgi:hypothetical protein